MQLVTERHGEGAGQIVKNVLQLGIATVGDLAEAYEVQPGSKRDSGIDTAEGHVSEVGMVNGIAKTAPSRTQLIATGNDLHSNLRMLLRAGILVKVSSRAFLPMSDLQDEIEETVIRENFPDRKVTGPKKAKEFAIQVTSLKRKWRDEEAFSELHDYASRGNIKRPGEHFTGPNKRIKVNGHLPNGHHADAEEAVPRLPVLCHCLAGIVQ